MTSDAGERVLDWMLRRLQQAVRLEHDLVIVHDSPALAGVGQKADVMGNPWRVARVTGELTLRDALPEADRLIALVPADLPPLPMDIAARTYLKRILEVRAEDVVAAASGHFCEALVDEELSRAVFDSLHTLRSSAVQWSLGTLVTAREVRSVLVGAELGAARLNRERDWELLAHWLLEGAPTFRAPSLVRAALEEAQPRTGAWLAWALTEGSLEALCTAGALLASAEGGALAPTIPGLSKTDHAQLVDLVDGALREVWRTQPARASEVLVEAERAARTVELNAAQHRLLRVPLEGALSRAANASAEGTPPDDVAIEGLKRNLHAPALGPSIDVVADLARLSRFQRLELPSSKGTTFPWFRHALRDVAWADLAYRRVRRSLDAIPAWLADPARRVLAAWIEKRDTLNAEFAESLAMHWAAIARNTDVREHLALQQLTRCLIRRLIDDGSRVFLVVLDGCDLSSFLEILDSIPASKRIGLTLPDVRDPVLRDDLAAMEALGVAISPLPTVTSHARRALFAGEIPGNMALDDTESVAANASADVSAWKRNSALGDIPRRLFLKGDLGAAGAPLLDALRARDLRAIATVFNGVDDALSSKETTPMPTWSLQALGAGAADAIQVAVEEGWTLVVTADHGHTPYVSGDRKVAGSALGHRFSSEPADGAVAFRHGPLPRQPLHLLTRFGAWFGQQRRGFHGGASIEEVVVPLAFIGRVRGEQEGRPRAPAWWWSAEGIPTSTLGVSPKQPKPLVTPTQSQATAPVLAFYAQLDTLSAQEKDVLALVQQNQAVRLSIVAQHTKKSPNRASGLMQQLMRKLFELGYPCLSVELLPDDDRLYRYEPVVEEKQ